ncbi:hypothetical protein SASPL_149494 [Salvia splendens]|uniref:Uncharacterized protein n=1 Tax=Salvia splendens TaxID=180675 RepID=A0A8X8WBQ9_SALSN|nr:hypothetical protein SASPL_149494 [Salvia splendens]
MLLAGPQPDTVREAVMVKLLQRRRLAKKMATDGGVVGREIGGKRGRARCGDNGEWSIYMLKDKQNVYQELLLRPTAPHFVRKRAIYLVPAKINNVSAHKFAIRIVT